nr:MAG TPA: hypothetical protein [Caudoviricetes sp.]
MFSQTTSLSVRSKTVVLMRILYSIIGTDAIVN